MGLIRAVGPHRDATGAIAGAKYRKKMHGVHAVDPN
jgi:hypothetical protein